MARRAITPSSLGLLALLAAFPLPAARAQPALPTSFTYQGELRTSGALAAGPHDLQFRLYDSLTDGSQVGVTLCSDNVTVSDGKFTIALDFGPIFDGTPRYLEIDVRADTGLDCTDATGYDTLLPRQALDATPYAQYAVTAGTALSAQSATQLNGQPASYYQDLSNFTAGTLGDAHLTGTYTSEIVLNNTANVFAGSGAALTALDATNITAGTLDDLRLSPNVALLNAPNIFTNTQNTFDGTVSMQGFQLGGATTQGYVLTADGSGVGTWQPPPPPGGGGSLTLPFAGDANAPGSAAVIFARNTATSVGYGLYGSTDSTAAGIGVLGVGNFAGTGSSYGVVGNIQTTAGSAVHGVAINTTGTGLGVYGEARASSGIGVQGIATSATGDTNGLRGQSNSTGGIGCYAIATASTGGTFGGFFRSQSNTGIGVYGVAEGNAGARGVAGLINSGGFAGVSGEHASRGNLGLLGTNFYGVYGASGSASDNFAGYFQGKVHVVTPVANYGVEHTDGTRTLSTYLSPTICYLGTRSFHPLAFYVADGGPVVTINTDSTVDMGGHLALSQLSVVAGSVQTAIRGQGAGYGLYGTGGSYGVFSNGTLGASGSKPFRIDHPSDPENQYLLHYSTESPEVLNAYRGTVTLDATGEAMVTMPTYFAAINKDPSYTLTAVGAPMPMLHVADEIDAQAMIDGAKVEPGQPIPPCAFRIAGGMPGAKVSWRVEAIRNDRWMQSHGAPVEMQKPKDERGAYQQPDLYHQPATRMVFAPEPTTKPANPDNNKP